MTPKPSAASTPAPDPTGHSGSPDPFTPPNADEARTQRTYASLFRIAERHAATDGQRRRQVHPLVLSPHEAVRLVSFLLSGGALLEDGEPEVDRADITAALSLVPSARAEMDELEVGLLEMARGRGMTWPEIAFGLGLQTPQAARQRYERLASRTERSTESAESVGSAD
ncbi:DNA-binding protein [Streptomyces heilongjiangensis]|uniref:DNA-binding protein n=1 Tax=Streptomyces heilongjiangensis TaxID=945052 RepID=A0ABW1BAM0_9ACTN|nr:DNA-binding protein [Streptomyces heilongjiangensis]MDC2950336.1 DNA-binding protein [Streptomyces heilongjiangensis]